MSLQWKMTQPFPRTKQLSINWYEQPSKHTAALQRKTTQQYRALPSVWASVPGCLPLLHVAFTPLLSPQTPHSFSSITCRHCFRDTPPPPRNAPCLHLHVPPSCPTAPGRPTTLLAHLTPLAHVTKRELAAAMHKSKGKGPHRT